MANQQYFSFDDPEPAISVGPAACAPPPALRSEPVSAGTPPNVPLKRGVPEPDDCTPVRDEAPQQSVLEKLRSQVGCISTARQDGVATFSTGSQTIDSWLPDSGLHPSALTDWIAAHESAAAGTLALCAAVHRLKQVPDRPLVIVDCDGTFYPPAAVALGVPSGKMILLRPRGGSDAIWAVDQSLRSGAVAAVWAALPMRIDDHDARRLQLAAEAGRTPGLFVRGFSARRNPGFSDVQFYVSQQRDHHPFQAMTVTLDRVRGGIVGRRVELRMDDRAVLQTLPTGDQSSHETAARHLASRLANPTTSQRTGGRVARRNRTA